tara:strand:- start:731 stop:838 length:108 start_codon:yes stop_codon:yes gene_type:complete
MLVRNTYTELEKYKPPVSKIKINIEKHLAFLKKFA